MEISLRPIMEKIDIASSGPNVLVNGNPSQYIYIKQIAVIASGGANTLILQKTDGVTTTDLAEWPLQANGSFVFENTQPDLPFWIDIEPGWDLQLDLSAATAVKGHIIYGYRK